MKIHSARGFKMVSWTLVPTVTVTVDRGYFKEDAKRIILTFRILKYAASIIFEY